MMLYKYTMQYYQHFANTNATSHHGPFKINKRFAAGVVEAETPNGVKFDIHESWLRPC